jgi:hypothetical protein
VGFKELLLPRTPFSAIATLLIPSFLTADEKGANAHLSLGTFGLHRGCFVGLTKIATYCAHGVLNMSKGFIEEIGRGRVGDSED